MVTIENASCPINLQIRTAMRKYTSEGRVVYAWTSMGAVATKSLRFQGQGIIVFERSLMAPAQTTMLKTWHRMHADLTEAEFGSESEIEMLKVVGMKALSRNTMGYFSTLENVLLEAAAVKAPHALVPPCIAW